MTKDNIKMFIPNLLVVITFALLSLFLFLFKTSFAANLSTTGASTYWDGTTVSASLSGNGDSTNPYLIANGADFAKFVEMVNSSDTYAAKSYKITNDIYLNKGSFDYYNDSKVTFYYIDGHKYYAYYNNYYSYYNPSNSTHGNSLGSINSCPKITRKFTGTLNGYSHSIIGYYRVTGAPNEALFAETEYAMISNLKIVNSVIAGNGGNIGVIAHDTGSVIQNVLSNSIIYNSGSSSASDATYTTSTSGTGTTLTISYVYMSHQLKISGSCTKAFTYNNRTYSAGTFNIYVYPDSYNEDGIVQVRFESNNGALSFSNLSVKQFDYTDNTGFIAVSEGGAAYEYIATKGYHSGKGAVGGIVASYNTVGNSSFYLDRSYNTAQIQARNCAGGIIGFLSRGRREMSNIFNTGKVSATLCSGGIIGQTTGSNSPNFTLTLNNSFNTGEVTGQDNYSGQIIGVLSFSGAPSPTLITTVTFNKVYYTYQNAVGVNSVVEFYGTLPSYMYKYSLLGTSNLQNMNYKSYRPTATDPNYAWYFVSGSSPRLNIDQNYTPTITITYSDQSWTRGYHTITKYYASEEGLPISATVTSSKDIAKVEYYLNTNYSTTNISETSDTFINGKQLYTGQEFTVNNGDSKTLYIKATDIYGNTSYAYSNLIIADFFLKTSYQEGAYNFDLSSLPPTGAYSKDSLVKFRIRHDNNFTYNSSAKLYFEYVGEEGPISSGTIITLYDVNSDELYEFTSNGQDYSSYYYNEDYGYYEYYYPLTVFKSVNNSSISYNNNATDFHSSGQDTKYLEFAIDAKNTINFQGGEYGIIIAESNLQQPICANYYASIFYSARAPVDLTAAFSGTISTLNPNIKNNMITANIRFSYYLDWSGSTTSHSFYDYDRNAFIKDYYIEARLKKSNGSYVTNYAHNNIVYILSNVEYNCNSNGVAYIPIEFDNTSNYRSRYYYSSSPSINIKVYNNNYLDILNGTYKLELKLVNEYNPEYNSTLEVPLSNITIAKSRGGISFTGSIKDADRVINSTNGKTKENDTNMTVYTKYSGSLTTPTMKMKICRHTTENTCTSVSPGTIFNTSSLPSTVQVDGSTLVYTYPSSSSGVNRTIDYPLKTSSLTKGNYSVTMELYNSTSRVSTEHTSFIIK